MPVLFLTVFIDFVGFGIIIPILPFFGLRYGASPLEIAFLFAIYSTVQFFSGPLWGRLSDRIGRRPVLLLTLAGAALAYVAFGFADSFATLLLARGLSGLMAGNMGIANAMVADSTGPERRAGGMATLGAAISLGFVVGPLLGSLLVGNDPLSVDHAFPAFTAAALSGAAFLLGLVMLKETLPQARRRTANQPAVGRLKIVAMMRAIPYVPVLVLHMAVLSYVVSQMTAVFPLWSEQRLAWGPHQISYLFAAIGLIVATMQAGVVGRLNRRLGDGATLLVGAVIATTGLVAVILSRDSLTAGAAICLSFAGTSLCTPVITSLISRLTPAEHQGGVLGASNSAASLGRIVGPPVGGGFYQALGPAWPFAAAAGLVALIGIWGWRYRTAGDAARAGVDPQKPR